VPGTSIGCDDGNPCTQDRCVDAACVHTPLSGPACNDRDHCTENDHCAAGVCVGTPVVCPDDGFSCTDEACVGGDCVHVPVDSRCTPTDACTTSACAPQQRGHDPSGCTPGPPAANGSECAEDGDACTSDVCGDGRCLHEPVADRATCNAVEIPFRQALALENAARSLESTMSAGISAPLLARLSGVGDLLGTTARVLSGKTASTTTARPPGALAETPLQQRARTALGILVQARPQTVALAHDLGRPTAGASARQIRVLLRGTRALRAELRRLLVVRTSLVR
jgi:hypothetical protein